MTRLKAWEQHTEYPLVAAALLFLVAYALPILDTGMASGWKLACSVVLAVTWLVFIADFLTQILLAEHRGRFLLRHVPDLLVLAVPMLRPLRLLRLLVLIKVLNRQAGNALRGKVAIYVGAAAATVIFCAALAVLDAERGHQGANIATFGDAVWWAATTVTTVGYGDRYPVTVEGRFVAIGLMIAGIALIGVVTASFATWLIDKVRQVEAESQAVTAADVNALRTEMIALREQLAQHNNQSARG